MTTVQATVSTLAPAGSTAVAVASRPRTLVLVIAHPEIAAMMFGPKGEALGTQIRVEIPAEPRAIQAMWPLLEPLGEFDRISVVTKPGLGAGWDPATLTSELQHQSGRHVRHIALAELRSRHVIRGTGVELVLSFGAELDSWLFVDGVPVPGLALGRHRFRKGRTYQEYLAPRVLARKGARTWNRRLARVIREVLDVWNPTTLYLSISQDVDVELEPSAHVQIVRSSNDFVSALKLWQ